MPLPIALVSDASDFSQICPMDHDAWLTPDNPQLEYFRPTFATREESIAYVIARKTKQLNEQNSNTFMIKVTDDETNEIIGFAVWAVNDPGTSSGEKTVASWHPEGSEERQRVRGMFHEQVMGIYFGTCDEETHGLATVTSTSLILRANFGRFPFHYRTSFTSTRWRRTFADTMGNFESGRAWN